MSLGVGDDAAFGGDAPVPVGRVGLQAVGLDPVAVGVRAADRTLRVVGGCVEAERLEDLLAVEHGQGLAARAGRDQAEDVVADVRVVGAGARFEQERLPGGPPDPQHRRDDRRRVPVDEGGGRKQLCPELRVLDTGNVGALVAGGGVVEVVVVDQAAAHRQQLADRDPVAVGKQPRQPPGDRVADAKPPCLRELQDQRRRVDLAHALQPHPRVHRHPRARARVGDPRRPQPASVRPGHVRRSARRKLGRPRNGTVEDPLQPRTRRLRRFKGACPRRLRVEDSIDRNHDPESRHGRDDQPEQPPTTPVNVMQQPLPAGGHGTSPPDGLLQS